MQIKTPYPTSKEIKYQKARLDYKENPDSERHWKIFRLAYTRLEAAQHGKV